MSYLYSGKVYHCRVTPTKHEFEYPVFYVKLDIKNITEKSTPSLFSFDSFNLLSVQSKNFAHKQYKNLNTWIDSIFKQNHLEPSHKISEFEIFLQTFPKVLGYSFNPVSFWFLKYNGKTLYMIAEVNNTFGGRHCYLIHENGMELQKGKKYSNKKVFHVSPFNDVEGFYNFIFSQKKSLETVTINYYKNNQMALATYISGSPIELSNKNILKQFLKIPFQSIYIVLMIHWHAVLLYSKKVPFIGKSPRKGELK